MLIIALGGGIDLKGNLPLHVIQRLNKVIELYKKHPGSKIAVSGRYSFLHDKKIPKITESFAMRTYLVDHQIPRKDIFVENKSKDTIGNAYYLKKDVVLPKKIKDIIVVTSTFHLPRTRYIFEKLFDATYHFTFVKVDEQYPKDKHQAVIKRQATQFEKTKKLLSPMKKGDHNFLSHKIYNFKYYKEERPSWVTKFVAEGK